MRNIGIFAIVLFIRIVCFGQDALTLNGPGMKVTSYDELSSLVNHLDQSSDLLNVKVIGQSVAGRNLYAMMFSSSRFGKDNSKIRVLIFAQQHGNEQSGKEGALLLAKELLKPQNRYLFDKIDFLLVPQVNPDGSELNERRNAHDADLNRNHLTLSEPETRALDNVFNKYLFEVTMDVHEYFPYGDEYKSYGYRKNSDVTLGATTNLNVSKQIRDLSDNDYLPFIFNYLNEKGFSSFEYCPGGPPEINYIRHSTFDINDGRQSLGIQNTFSFIQEGMNGEDSFVQNLAHRAEAQMNGMRGLLEYAYRNRDKIKSLVAEERDKLISGSPGEQVSVQSEHAGNGQKLEIPLLSYYSGIDSVVTVNDYRPVVISISNVSKPYGYLIPRQLPILVEWAGRHSFELKPLKNPGNYIIEEYFVNRIDSIDFEGDIVVDPQLTVREFQGAISSGDYLFLKTAQLKGNLIVLALEPKSMLGLVTYKEFAHLIKTGEAFPVLRVINK